MRRPNPVATNDARALKVWFVEDSMRVSLVDGRTLSVPKACFPRLLSATQEQLEAYEMSGHGTASLGRAG